MRKLLTGASVIITIFVLAQAGFRALPLLAQAPSTAQAESGIYTEDFATYTAKDASSGVRWDVWTRSLQLASPPNDRQVQRPSAIVAQEDGGAVFLWEDANGQYARRFDQRGNPLWPDEVSIQASDILKDGLGNLLMAWADAGSVYAQKLDREWNPLWGSGIQLNTAPGSADPGEPRLALDTSGNLFVVWWDNRNGVPDVYAQKLTSSGARVWASERRVANGAGAAWNASATLVPDANSDTLILWRVDGDDFSRQAVYGQKHSVSGQRRWATDRIIIPDISSWGLLCAIRVGTGYRIAWLGFASNDDWWGDDLLIASMNDAGQEIWRTLIPDISLGAVGWGFRGLRLAVDGSDTIVGWICRYAGDYEPPPPTSVVFAQRLDANGRLLWPSDTRLAGMTGDAYDLALSVGGQGELWAAWRDPRNDAGDVYAQRFSRSGSRLWPEDLRVNSNVAPAEQRSPSVCPAGDGDTFIVWTDDRSGSSGVYLQRVDRSSNKRWKGDVRVDSTSAGITRSDATVAADPGGGVWVVWVEDDLYGAHEIRAQRFDPDGNRLWQTEAIVHQPQWDLDVRSPSIAPDNQGHLSVVYLATQLHYWTSMLCATRLDATGLSSGFGILRGTYTPGLADPQGGRVAVDPAGNMIVAWSETAYNETTQHDDEVVCVQKWSSVGGPVWAAPVRLSINEDPQIWGYNGGANVAVDSQDNILVAWVDKRSGDDNIYTQKLRADGRTLWSSDVRVNSDSGTAVQSRPALALDSSDNLYVTWNDDRNGVARVYAQKLAPTGNKRWSLDMPVNVGTAAAFGPAMTVDASESPVVSWLDERNNNWDLYVQRLSPTGTRVWSGDLQVVYPDMAYVPLGTARSLPIDTVAGDLRQATLTADYETNGGDVSFSLTNDGGTHWAGVIPGVTHVFTTTGSDLRWRADLTGDPLWPRTPVIHSLRIEYSTQAPYADDYEDDDSCLKAKPIAATGASQSHTFHQQADADWAWFDAIAGTTYIIQTSNVQEYADTRLEIYDACAGAPVDSDDNALGREARLRWTAPLGGPTRFRAYVKALNRLATAYGPATGYDLSVRELSRDPIAVVVGGRNDVWGLQTNIDYAADTAYRTFLNAGVPKANLRYLSASPNRDVDGNGHLDDIAGKATVDSVRNAIQGWARERGVGLGVPFFLVLVDHGYYDQFLADGSAGKITASDLNLWLSNLEATTGADKVTVIIEACHSGSFIDVTEGGPAEISGRNRVVITSTSSRLNAYTPLERGAYFSDAFWTWAGQGRDLLTAFQKGTDAVLATGRQQEPWLDDNADALADSRDGALARSRGLGVNLGSNPPAIDWVEAGRPVNATAQIRAQVRDDFGVSRVWAVIYPPDFVEPPPAPEGQTPVLNVPSVTLTPASSAGYHVWYTGFTQLGSYRIVVYAEDGDGNLAMPAVVLMDAGPRQGSVSLPLVLRRR